MSRWPRTVLQDFKIVRPKHECSQADALAWLGRAHAQADARINQTDSIDAALMTRLLERYGCGPSRIARRGTELDDIFEENFERMPILGPARLADDKGGIALQAGAGISERMRFFDRVARQRLDELFAAESCAPDHLIQVTCTGYVAPSAAQGLVAARGWTRECAITHVFHMGCYASLPAIRIADGFRAAGVTRTDIAHTEMCTLHLNLTDHAAEQLVVQSLFADGYIKYSAMSEARAGTRGIEVLAIHEEILPESQSHMTWVPSEWGFQMTLSREVPTCIAKEIRGFIERLMASAKATGVEFLPKDWKEAIFAIHPGGPRIIDQLQVALEVRDDQVRHAKEVLLQYGNMSSATLPHIWRSIIDDAAVPAGTWIVSLAFGPGLTAIGSLMRKRC